MSQTALITGATAGIGEATAHKLSKNGYDVILTGRRQERLDALKNEIEAAHGNKAYAMPLDVRERNSVKQAIDNLPNDWQPIDLLINNAGLAKGLATIDEGDIDHWDQMVDTNIKGLLYVTRQVSPLMVNEGNGHIINVGSLAGKEVYPKGNVYASSKHFVDALTESMRIDLIDKGVKVSQVCPGLVETEFSEVRFDGDEERARKVYQGYRPLKPEDIADVIYWQASAPSHVNIADVLVISTDQANSTTVNKANQ